MPSSFSLTSAAATGDREALRANLLQLLDRIPELPHGYLVQQALALLADFSMADSHILDWKLLLGAMQDMQRAVDMFYPFRHTRKVSIFGSARMAPTEPEYQQAVCFARCITAQGFMVLTGAGGGIMAAGNEGAGREHSFGLNIDLPFEQDANPHISSSDRLIDFKYFFTRKLFFMRETDAIVLFPGGFGTQDEFFECLTLCQTGKSPPKPLVLIDKPGGDYWLQWDAYMAEHLLKRQLISPEDRSLYHITDSVEQACKIIANFYSIYHSSRWVGDLFVLRLNFNISDRHLERLNRDFADLLHAGEIARCSALAEEGEELVELPRLCLQFNRRQYGRLYEFIHAINDTRDEETPPLSHPESK